MEDELTRDEAIEEIRRYVSDAFLDFLESQFDSKEIYQHVHKYVKNTIELLDESEKNGKELVTINADTHLQLRKIVALHDDLGAANKQKSVQCLVDYVLGAVVDGFNRPGSWEGELVEKMGLMPDF